MSLTKIGSIGINTGIAFAGVTTIVTLNTANDALSIGATVNVGSGITLGASGDIFATGVSTVTTLKVGSGVTVSSDGDVFATGVTTSTTFSGAFSGSGANITALNASNISSGTVPTARLGSGTASSSTFLRGDSTFQTVNTDLVSDTSPQLGGNLDVNTKNIVFGDSSGATDDRLTFGAGTDLSIFHNGSNSKINNATGTLYIEGTTEIWNSAGSETLAKFTTDGGVQIYYDNSVKLETRPTGLRMQNTSTFDVNGGLIKLGHCSSAGTDDTLMFGSNGDDLKIYHGGNSQFDNNTGNMELRNVGSFGSTRNIFIRARVDESSITCKSDGAVELYHDNTKQCETSADGLSFPSGKGINFSATANSSGSMSSETLDDYEEGTWSPTLSSGTATSYLNQWYTKVGQQVTCYVYLYNFSDTSSNTHFNISGLPFAYKTNHEATVQFMSNGSANLSSNCMGIWGRIGVTGNSDQIAVYTHFNTTGGGQFSHNNLGSTHLMATFTYVTAS